MLEVGVLRDDTREHAETLHVVGIDLRVRVGQVSGTLDLDSSCCGEGTSGDRNWEGSRLVVALGLSIVLPVGLLLAIGRPARREPSLVHVVSLVELARSSRAAAIADILLQELNQVLNDLESLRAVEHVQIKRRGVVLPLDSKILLVLHLELMAAANLGKLVVSNVEVSALLNLHVVDASSSCGS